MKTSRKLLLGGLFIIAFVAFVGKTYAITPSLSLSGLAGTDNVIVTVNGDTNASVTLYHYNTYSQLQTRYLGTTNSYGYFSITVSTNNYNITPGGTVYVIVNNQQSSSMIWPFTASDSFPLSQTSVSLYVGQTSTINAYSGYSSVYLSSNSNQGVATATIYSNTISIYGQSTGSTTMRFCQSGSTYSCANVYVTVGGSSTTSNTLNLSISNLILPVGSSATVSSPNSVGLYVSSNSNRNVVSAASSVLSTTGCTAGSLYSVTTGLPCSNSYLSNYYSNSYVPGCTATSLYSVITGQPCYGGYNNNYNLTNSGGSVTISALSAGSSTVTLCQSGVNAYYGNSCSTIYVTVTGNYLNSVTPSYTNPVYDYSNVPIVYSR